MSVQTDLSIASLVEEMMAAHDAAYDEIVCDPEADDVAIIAALIVQLLHDLPTQDVDIQRQAVAYLIRWHFGDTVLEVMSHLGPALEEMMLRRRRQAR